MEASQLEESVSLATSARSNNLPTRHLDLDFELLTSRSEHGVDVHLRRTARNAGLKPVIYKRSFESRDSALRKAAIVSIRNHSVEIKRPNRNAHAKRIKALQAP